MQRARRKSGLNGRSGVDGVENCAVNLLTNSMGVEGTASDEAIIAAVEKAGYGASLKTGDKKSKAMPDDELKDTQTPKIRNRLIWSVIFLAPLMYISMGHMMWGWPLAGNCLHLCKIIISQWGLHSFF